jgi:hypothetical protein
LAAIEARSALPARAARSSRLEAAIVPFPIGGRSPRPENVSRIREAIAGKVPSHLISAWLANDGRMEVIAGLDASTHPRYPRSGNTAGFCLWISGGLAVVAGDRQDCEHIALHEFSHAIDRALRYVSKGSEWLDIWARESDKEPWALHYYRDFAEEFFAECCARFWSGRPVCQAAADFINFLA